MLLPAVKTNLTGGGRPSRWYRPLRSHGGRSDRNRDARDRVVDCADFNRSKLMGVDQERTAPPPDNQWQTLAKALARAVRRQCPAWLAADADDIAQLALTKVMKSDKVGEGNAPLSPFYIHRVAHSALVDEIRRRRRRREVSLESDSESGEMVLTHEPAAQGTPESAASLRELGSSLRACLKDMKRERRLAVVLYLQGHSVPEAARLLGWVVKNTENLAYRGLADLRQCLMAKGHTT